MVLLPYTMTFIKTDIHFESQYHVWRTKEAFFLVYYESRSNLLNYDITRQAVQSQRVPSR